MADEITCFMAAICRDKAEGGDGTKYFGSTMAYRSHEFDCQNEGLLDCSGNLTDKGRAVGDACKHLPDGRAYDNDQYDNAASDGGYETYLELASELIERCLEKAKCQCPACQKDGAHYSDCAVHREPADPNGPCSCGLV